MVNAVYHDKPLIFIKVVSDTVFGMINAVCMINAVNEADSCLLMKGVGLICNMRICMGIYNTISC